MYETLTKRADPAPGAAASGRCLLCGLDLEADGTASWPQMGNAGGVASGREVGDADGAAGGCEGNPGLCEGHRHELARFERARPDSSRSEALALFLESQNARRGQALRRFCGTLELLRR